MQKIPDWTLAIAAAALRNRLWGGIYTLIVDFLQGGEWDVSRATGRLRNEIRGGRDSRCVRDWVERGWECGRGFRREFMKISSVSGYR